MTRIIQTLRTLGRGLIGGSFTRFHFVAILLGIFMGGSMSLILFSGSEAYTPWWFTLVGSILGALIGISFTLSQVPPTKKR